MIKQKSRILLLIVVFCLCLAGIKLWALSGPHYWSLHVPGNPDYDDFNQCYACHKPHGAEGFSLWPMNTETILPDESYIVAMCRSCHFPGNEYANPVFGAAGDPGAHTPGHRFINVWKKFQTNYEAMGYQPADGWYNQSPPVDRKGRVLDFPVYPIDPDVAMDTARLVPCYACHDPHGSAYDEYPQVTVDHAGDSNTVSGFTHGGYIPRYQGEEHHTANYEEIDGDYHSETVFGQTADFDNDEIPSALDAHNYFASGIGDLGFRRRVRYPTSPKAYLPELSNGWGFDTSIEIYDTSDQWRVNDGGSVCAACHNAVTQIAGYIVPPPPLGLLPTNFGDFEISEHDSTFNGYDNYEFVNCSGCHNFDDPTKIQCDYCHGFPPNDDDDKNDNVGAVGAHVTHIFGEALSCPNCHFGNSHNESGITSADDWNNRVPSSSVANNVDIGFPTKSNPQNLTGSDLLYLYVQKSTLFYPYDSTFGPDGRLDSYPGGDPLYRTYPLTLTGYPGGTTMGNEMGYSQGGPLKNLSLYDPASMTCYVGCHNPVVFDTTESDDGQNLKNAAVWPLDDANPGKEVAMYTATLRCVDCHDQQGDLFDLDNPDILSQHPNFLAVQQDSRDDCNQCHQGHNWLERAALYDPLNPDTWNNWIPKLKNNPGDEGDAGTHPHTHSEGIVYLMDPDQGEPPDPSWFPTSYDTVPAYYIYDTDTTANPAFDTTFSTDGFCQECHDQGKPTGENYFPYPTGTQAPGNINTHTNMLPLNSGFEPSQHDFRAECLDCHRQHGAENLSLIRNEIYYPGAGGASGTYGVVKLLDVTGDDSFDGGADGICVICHYNEDPPGPDLPEGTVEVHNHSLNADTGGGTGHYDYDNKDCTSGCHMHETGFMPDCNRCHRSPPMPPRGGMTGRIAALYVSGDGISQYSSSPGATGAHVTHVYGEGYKCDMCHYNNIHAETPINSPDDWDRVVRDGFVTWNLDVQFDTSNMDTGLDTTEYFRYFFSRDILEGRFDSTFDTIPLYDTTRLQDRGEWRPVNVILSFLPGGTTISNDVPTAPENTLPMTGDFYQFIPDNSGAYKREARTCYVGCHNPIIGEEYETPNVDNFAKWPGDDSLPGFDWRLYSTIACIDCHDQQKAKFESQSHHPMYVPSSKDEALILRSRAGCTACHENHLWIEKDIEIINLGGGEFKYETTWLLFETTDAEFKKHTHTEGVVILNDADTNWAPLPPADAADPIHQQYAPDEPNKDRVYYGRSFYPSGANQIAPSEFCLECHNDIAERSDLTENSVLNQIDTTFAPNEDLELYYLSAGHGKDTTAVTNHPVQKACLECHTYHGSTGDKLFNTTGNEICFGCHEDSMDNGFYGGRTQYEASRHAQSPNSFDSTPPTQRPSSEAGFCLNCHNPHGAGPNSSVSTPPYQEGGYSDGYANMTNYFEEKLCYRCHNADAENWEEPAGTPTGNWDIQSLFGEHPSANYSTHDVDDDVQALLGDQIECTNCHNPHLVKSQTEFLSDPRDPSVSVTVTNNAEARDFCFLCHGDLGLPEGSASGEFPIAPSFPGADTTMYNKGKWFYNSGHGLSTSLSINDPPITIDISCYQSNLDAAIRGCHSPHGSANAKLIDEINIFPKDDTLGGMDTPEEMNAMCLSSCHQNKYSHTYTLWNGSAEDVGGRNFMNTGRPDAIVGLPFDGGTELGIRGLDEVMDSDVFNPAAGGMVKVRRHTINLPAYAQDPAQPGYGDTLPDYYSDFDSSMLYDTSDDIFTHPSASWVPYDEDGDEQPDNGDFDVLHAPNYTPESNPGDGLPFFRKGSDETGTLDPADPTARGDYDPIINKDYFICVTCHEPHGAGDDALGTPHPGMTRFEHRDKVTLCNKCHKFTAPAQ